MSFNKIRIEAVIQSDLAKTWDAWTKPEHITQWNFANDEWCCPSAENDLRVGGHYKARMEARDKSFGFDFEAIYVELVPQQRVTLKMADGRTATTTFDSLGARTKVTTIFDAEKQNSEEMQKNGWQAILNNFKKYVEEK